MNSAAFSVGQFEYGRLFGESLHHDHEHPGTLLGHNEVDLIVSVLTLCGRSCIDILSAIIHRTVCRSFRTTTPLVPPPEEVVL